MTQTKFHPTAYGRPAAHLLRERISAAKADDPLRPVTVVVPTNYAGVSTRRLLASGELGPITSKGSGIAGLRLLTVYRLAELLGAPRLAAQQRRPASTPVLAAAVRRVLSTAPGMFEPVRDHPATEEALVRVHRELSEVLEASLDRLAEQSQRAQDVVRIHRAVRTALQHGWYEEADLMSSACRALEAGTTILRDLGTVFVYLPQELSIPAAELITTLAGHAPVEVIAAFTGAADADSDVLRSLARLGIDAPPPADTRRPLPTAIEIVSDAEEEVRSAVDAILQAARQGTPFEAMAVVYPSPEPYARIVHEQLEAAGIPYSGRAVRPLSDRLAGRWLLDLLQLPDHGYARPAVMGLLTGTPLRDRDGSFVATGTWERISRDAGLVRGQDEWHAKLERYATAADSHAEEIEAEDPESWRAARLRRDAERARELLRHVSDLFADLERAQRLDDWDALSTWARETVSRYLGSEARRTRWPEVERQAADRLDAALARLGGLGDVEPHTDLEAFRRTLELELGADLGRVGEFGRGVLVGTPSTALGVDLEFVAVLGLAEGAFPTRPREDSLLPDAERQLIADELKPRIQRIGVEHRQFLACLAASRGTRLVTSPRGDLRRSIERVASRWLVEAVEALQSDAAEPRAFPVAAPWLRRVASFASRVQAAPFPTTRQHYDLRSLAGMTSRHALPTHPLVAGDLPLRRGVELVLARKSDSFSRFDGNLSPMREHLASPAARDRAVSATQLQSWLTCPHSYFMRYVLKIDPVENPEELLTITALEKGSLVHDVLERWLCAFLDRGELPEPRDGWPPAAEKQMRELAEEACDYAEQRGVTGHPLMWRPERARILADLDRFVTEDNERRRELRATPEGAELAFGFTWAGSDPVPIDLGDGRELLVLGKIDRLDRADDGTVIVADYKTGSTGSYEDISPEQPLGDGTMLQLPIYGLAVRAVQPSTDDVSVEYWFTSHKGGFERIGFPLTDDVVEELRAALRLVVDGIEAGHFPMRPAEPGWQLYTDCLYCDPDELGTADRYRRWERVRLHPELRDYVAYVDPEALPDEATAGAAEVDA